MKRIVITAGCYELALKLAGQGLGTLYILESAIKKQLAAGTMAVISEPPYKQSERCYVIYKKDFSEHAILSAFINELKKGINL